MFDSFKRRSQQKELMDDPAIGYDDFSGCLRDLEIVNKLTLAYRPTLLWLRQVLKQKGSSGFSILDTGCGGGDTLRFLARRLKKISKEVELTGVDLNPWSRRYAETKTDPTLNIRFETVSIFDYVPPRPVDFIISSLFTHHLDGQQLISYVQWIERQAAGGWFINDLHRHPLAFYGFRYLSKLFGFHPMVRHDGPISVARAFSKQDWLNILDAAHIPRDQVDIKWFFPFRYCLTRNKK